MSTLAARFWRTLKFTIDFRHFASGQRENIKLLLVATSSCQTMCTCSCICRRKEYCSPNGSKRYEQSLGNSYCGEENKNRTGKKASLITFSAALKAMHRNGSTS